MNEKTQTVNYDRIRIGIASSDAIRDWSCGEVLKPETINYRTLRPEKDGLFCERIFGTTKEWECYCGKFKSIRYKGVICDRCGVEVTHFKVRRERVGHIELSSPVAHIWFYKAVPSRIGLLLDLSIITLKSVIYYEKYIVTDPGGIPDLKKDALLSEDEYFELRQEYGSAFRAGIGAEIIREMLMNIDMEKEALALREKTQSSKSVDKRRLVRLGLLEDFINSSNRPEWMILDVIPVIPPEIRPMVQLEGGRFATSDLNDLYRRLLNRNNRLKKLLALKAPDIIIKNEKRMLQEAVDAIFDNARRKRAIKGAGNRPLKSLSDILKGKQGRFRQNLLGKRVDYSGRSVIVVGPDLKLHQCGLPRNMAIELFKPFIMRRLVERKIVFNIKSAKKLIDNQYPDVWRILEEVVKEHPILVNRAPTLHRLGIQAFEPVLTDEKAIRLHPLVCTAFNADFDGDQMAVHIPLTAEAQIEAWTLMLSSNNLLDPANGTPIVNPSQDIVLGIYNLTNFRREARGEGKKFFSREEILLAWENKVINIQAMIYLKREDGKPGFAETSAGRIIFSNILPGRQLVDRILSESGIKELIADILERFGAYETTLFLDRVKELGFHYSTYFGNTISIGDIVIPLSKKDILEKSNQHVLKIHQQYHDGLITDDERYQKIISLWTFANDQITKDMMTSLEKDRDSHNHLYIMATSGAKGSRQQIRQLAGMRGLMAKPSGDIIEMPITSNFKEGLSVLEYFISTHGARKGLSDTALKTADAGYLTRKLVDIAQDVTIEMRDCGTINGTDIYPIKVGDEIIEKLSERIVGRFTAEAIINPYTDEVLIEADQEITPEVAKQLDEMEVEKVRIRSVVTCDSSRGICQSCYGTNLASGGLVEIGEAVGIMASQSIGQPGTQLTMRTFHIGGTASSDVRDPEFRLPNPVVILNVPHMLLRNAEGKMVVPRKGYMEVATVLEKFKTTSFEKILVKHRDRVKMGQIIGEMDKSPVKAKKVSFVYINEEADEIMLITNSYQQPLEVGAIFNVEINKFIKKNQVIYKFDPINEPIIVEASGTIRYQDIIIGKTLKEEMDEFTGMINKRIMETKEEQLQPKLVVVTDKGEPREIDLPAGTVLRVKDGAQVQTGDVVARKIRTIHKTIDITGGLPRVQELFEARNPPDVAVIASIDGVVEIGATLKGKRSIQITNEFGDIYKHLVPSGKALTVRNGDFVKTGEPLCEGLISPHDILRIQGETSLYHYVLESVQEVYKRQGVNINDKHIGVIIRQMLRKVEIIDPGDTPYIRGELVDKYRLRENNHQVIKEGGKPASASPVLLGLTKASLNTESFISSASFQETTKVLTNAAIKSVSDELEGLKENVIIGSKIPAGTGKKYYDRLKVYKNVVGDLDFIDNEEEDVEIQQAHSPSQEVASAK